MALKHGLLAAGLATLLACGITHHAHASCDAIPSASRSLAATLGSVDRPFAAPGTFVEVLLDPACASASPGFSFSESTGRVSDVVSVVFKPASGPRSVVVLAEDCASLEARREACEARGDVASARCIEANATDGALDLLLRPDRPRTALRFRFPDSDALLAAPDDDRTLAGPAAVAVTGRDDPLPCALASRPCSAVGGLVACVDQLFAPDGTCGTAPHAVFAHFTALPPPNDFSALCTDPASGVCSGSAGEIRLALDADGNVLLPMDFRGVLVDPAVPVARLLRAAAHLAAFDGGSAPLRIPSGSFLASYSVEGQRLPPVFDPQAAEGNAGLTLFGSADAPESVLRVARHSPSGEVCQGGASDGLPCVAADGGDGCPGGTCTRARCTSGARGGEECVSSSECPGSSCGPALFDFASRVFAAAGPVVVPLNGCLGGDNALAACSGDAGCPGGGCTDVALAALDPVPTDGVFQTETVSAFVLDERISDTDENRDGDRTDPVIKIASRRSGMTHPLGPGGAPARAIARVRRAPVHETALALEGSLAAFLEPEPLQSGRDASGNAVVFESLLRAYESSGTELRDLVGPSSLAVDGAPLVEGRSVHVSAGRVFYRRAEWSSLPPQVELVSGPAAKVAGAGFSMIPALSDDGRFVAFVSQSDDLVPGDGNRRLDVFVRDRLTGTLERVSAAPGGADGDGDATGVALSGDGTVVAFASRAGNLVAGDTNGVTDIFVRELGSPRTTRVSVSSQGVQANGGSFDAALSRDGRFVVFKSLATNLAAGSQGVEVFVHDRATGETALLGRGRLGAPGAPCAECSPEGRPNRDTAISQDGRVAAFSSNAIPVPGAPVPDVSHVFAEDLVAGTRTLVSVASDGTPGNGFSTDPSVSGDGRFIAFASDSTNLVPGDTNGAADVFVHDLVTRRTTRASVASNGEPGNSGSFGPSISTDGQLVAFHSSSSNLVPDGPFFGLQVYLHDLTTGQTAMVSRSGDGTPGSGGAEFPALAGRGGTLTFHSWAADLAPGADDRNGERDVYVRALDSPAGDRTGDGDADDRFLEVLDGASGSRTALCPAERVAVAGGAALFLRPEAAGPAPWLPACPSPDGAAGDLNGDRDAADEVVHFWPGAGMVRNLGRAAVDVALSGSWLAASVSERADGGRDLNGDGDVDDAVVHVRALGDGAWTNLGQAADVLAARGDVVAFVTPEHAQGADLNGDGDRDDRVVQLFVGRDGGSVVRSTARAAEDFVLGPTGLVAFRTRERHQGRDLNGDGDLADDVLQVYDPERDLLLDTGQAVTPCLLAACDPRTPYRVLETTVRFLTFEADQGPGGSDLNGDGDVADLVLQVFNVEAASDASLARDVATTATHGRSRTLLRPSPSGRAVLAVTAVSTGICTTTGLACAGDESCGTGACFVPPGGCVAETATPCNPRVERSCPADQFCEPQPGRPGEGRCARVSGSCLSDGDCAAGTTCRRAAESALRLSDPLGPAAGGLVLPSSGRCVERGERCSFDEDCARRGVCRDGACERELGSCDVDEQCPPDAHCRQTLVSRAVADRDGDEIPDPLDNCPDVANAAQRDANRNGVGDACDRATCGAGSPGCSATRPIRRRGDRRLPFAPPDPGPLPTDAPTPAPSATPTPFTGPTPPPLSCQAELGRPCHGAFPCCNPAQVCGFDASGARFCSFPPTPTAAPRPCQPALGGACRTSQFALCCDLDQVCQSSASGDSTCVPAPEPTALCQPDEEGPCVPGVFGCCDQELECRCRRSNDCALTDHVCVPPASASGAFLDGDVFL